MCHTLITIVTRKEISMNTTNGKIAEHSKQKIADALLRVMEQYTFKEITVTQLAQESQLSRKTFYRLFQDKESVLSYLFEKIYIECLSEIKSKELTHYWDIVQCYFDFWGSRPELLALLNHSGLLPALFEGAYKYSGEIFMQVRSQQTITEFSVPLPYLLAYSMGGIHSMLIKWAESGMEIPSNELISKLRAAFKSEEI